MKKIFILVLTIFAIPSFSYATEFGGHAGINWGLGHMYNDKENIPTRTMNTLAAQVLPGIHLNQIVAGILAEFQITGQNTEPADVANQNLKGKGYTLGVGGTYDFNKFHTLASIDFIGKYSLDKVDPNNQESSYSKPFGFHLLFGYNFKPDFSLDLMAKYVHYSKNTLGTTDADIGDNKLKHWNIAIGASYHI